MSKKNSKENIYKDFLPEFSDRIQRIADTYLDKYNEHSAFVYLVAELFETTQESLFEFSDGSDDAGIDFFVKDESSYVIAQCKCPVIDNLLETQEIHKFDDQPLDELLSAISILQDDQGDYKLRKEISQLRGEYQMDLNSDQDDAILTAILAVFGELTDSARKKFKANQAKYAAQNIHLKLIEWKDIHHEIYVFDSPTDIDFKLSISFDDENDLLAHRDYCYVLANAFDFYTAFKKHEWNLFEWNVRYQIHNSPINRRIVKTLKKQKGRKSFHHFNNGLLITCKSYSLPRQNNQKQISLNGPQIINGCQTVRAICEAYDSLPPSKQKHFRENTRVQVKIIRTTDLDFISDLVISTNDQNPMKPRNLKSNSNEQRSIQTNFRELMPQWFYERKDGEFESLRATSSKVRWFRKSDYAVSRKKFRIIDNQELAKYWYAFIGYSEKSLRGGIKYFSDDQDVNPYDVIFKSEVNSNYWDAFKEEVFNPKEDHFSFGTTHAYQYLLAYGVAKYVNSQRISYKNNRDDAVLRGIRASDLEGDPNTGEVFSTLKEVDEYLANDRTYNINIMVNNMQDLIVEMFAFVLTNKYGAIDPIISQKIVNSFEEEKAFFEHGFDKKHISNEQNGTKIFGPIYGFIFDCVRQYYFKYEAEINAAARLKTYLARRKTINNLRKVLIERNSTILEYDAEWKELGKSFFDSLPMLP